jgi:hypothetical protein
MILLTCYLLIQMTPKVMMCGINYSKREMMSNAHKLETDPIFTDRDLPLDLRPCGSRFLSIHHRYLRRVKA